MEKEILPVPVALAKKNLPEHFPIYRQCYDAFYRVCYMEPHSEKSIFELMETKSQIQDALKKLPKESNEHGNLATKYCQVVCLDANLRINNMRDKIRASEDKGFKDSLMKEILILEAARTVTIKKTKANYGIDFPEV